MSIAVKEATTIKKDSLNANNYSKKNSKEKIEVADAKTVEKMSKEIIEKYIDAFKELAK